MRTSILQKLQLAVVFLTIGIISFGEKIAKYVLRFSAIFIISLAILTGFNLDNNSVLKSIQNLPLLFSSSPEVLGTSAIDFPIYIQKNEFPEVSAKAVFASDIKENKVLVNLNGETPLAPASTTKLMTALVAADLYSTNEKLQIPEFCTEVEGQKSGFEAGEIYTVENLLKGLLINSSADAACTLSVSRVNYQNFINLMNEKADNFGMTNTNFTNPIGLDSENNDHISTARDLHKLAVEAVKNPLIQDYVKTKTALIKNIGGREIYIWNTNNLLWKIPGSIGIKTGTTESAGEVLIYRYKLDQKDIVIVVMGSDDRFEDTTRVLNWTLQNYNWGF